MNTFHPEMLNSEIDYIPFNYINSNIINENIFLFYLKLKTIFLLFQKSFSL